MARVSYARNVFKHYLRSFKDLKNTFLPLYLMDILFFALLTVGLMILARASSGFVESYRTFTMLAPTQSVYALLQRMLWSVGLTAIVFYAIFLTIYSVLKGNIWLVIARQNANRAFLWKYFLMQLAWMTTYIVALTLLLISARPTAMPYILYVFIFLWLHLTPIMSWHLTRHHSIRSSIKKAVTLGARVHVFVLPYTLALLTYLLLVQVFWLVPLEIRLDPQGNTIAFITLILAPYFAWMRTFLYRLYESKTI